MLYSIPAGLGISKPEWLKKRLDLTGLRTVKQELRDLKLHSVCEEASCPNMSECFAKGVSTVMIMGDICTRSCKFCDVKSGKPLALDVNEPENVAQWIHNHKYRHIVITSVDRDDLKDDLGSTHFAKVIVRAKEVNPTTSIEVLTPDFQGREVCLQRIVETPIQVFNHNLETIERLTPHVRSASNYQRSLNVIAYMKKAGEHYLTKSGMMLGLGESRAEVLKAMQDLRDHGCDLLTLGQYLSPSNSHLPVKEYITPEQFEAFKICGLQMGFRGVFSGPFVRSSYLADEFIEGILPEASGFTV